MSSNTVSQEKQTQRSKKLRSACDTCHQTKVRCSGGNPCQMCQHMRAECVYSPSGRKGRPKGTRPRKVLEQENRMTILQSDTTDNTVSIETGTKSHSRQASGKQHAQAGEPSDLDCNIFGSDLEDLTLSEEYREMLSSSNATAWPRRMNMATNDMISKHSSLSLPDNPFYDMSTSFDTASFPAWENWFQTSSDITNPWHWSSPSQGSESLGNWSNESTTSPRTSQRQATQHGRPSFNGSHHGGFGSNDVYPAVSTLAPSPRIYLKGGGTGAGDIPSEENEDCLQRHTVTLCHQLGRVRLITTPRIDVLLICAREIISVCFSLLTCSRCQDKDIHENLIIIIAVLRLFIRKLQLSDAKYSTSSTDSSSGISSSSRASNDPMLIDNDGPLPRNANTRSASHSSWNPPSSQLQSGRIAPTNGSVQPNLVPVSVGDYQTTKSELMLVTDVLRKAMLQRLSELITAIKRRIPGNSFDPASLSHEMIVEGASNAQSLNPDNDNNSDADGDTDTDNDNDIDDTTNSEEFGDLAHFMGILQRLEGAVEKLSG